MFSAIDRVRQGRYSFGFACKARERLWVCRKTLGEHLDGDVPFQTRIPRPVDLTHAACAERRDNLVHSQLGTWLQSHMRDCNADLMC